MTLHVTTSQLGERVGLTPPKTCLTRFTRSRVRFGEITTYERSDNLQPAVYRVGDKPQRWQKYSRFCPDRQTKFSAANGRNRAVSPSRMSRRLRGLARSKLTLPPVPIFGALPCAGAGRAEFAPAFPSGGSPECGARSRWWSASPAIRWSRRRRNNAPRPTAHRP